MLLVFVITMTLAVIAVKVMSDVFWDSVVQNRTMRIAKGAMAPKTSDVTRITISRVVVKPIRHSHRLVS